MGMRVIKPSSANWILLEHDCVRSAPDIVHNGFCKADIVDGLKDVY